MKIGILGAGQLARMLALAGYPIGHTFVFLSPDPKSCATSMGKHICADYDDEIALKEFVASSDIITYETENIPIQTLKYLQKNIDVYPPIKALYYSQDRFLEKQLFQKLLIPTPKYVPVNSIDELYTAAQQVGLPAVLKTCRNGYDGKGQAVLQELDQLNQAWEQVNRTTCILETMISFDREVSIFAVRGLDKKISYYPISENIHQDGILRTSICRINDPIQEHAEFYIEKLLTELDYVGIMALELFQVGGELIANEIAPRVHNTGHWTIEGSVTSQFENHIRAITRMPLGSVKCFEPSVMVNFIGSIPDPTKYLELSNVHFHHYGKDEQPGRKVGHATFCGEWIHLTDMFSNLFDSQNGIAIHIKNSTLISK